MFRVKSAFLILLALCLICQNSLADTRTLEPLRIGAILPLSGPGAFAGDSIRRGMQLALKDHPEADLQIFYEDDKSADRAAAVSALNKLISVNDVQIVLNALVNTISAMSPILNQQKIPGIVVWDNNRTIQKLGSYVFGMGFSTELAGEDIAAFIYDKTGAKTASIISVQDEWSDLIAEAFKQKFLQSGGKIVDHEKLSAGDTDLRTVLTKVTRAVPDAIYFPLWGQQLLDAIKHSRSLGYKGKLLTGDVFSDNEIKILGKNAEGVYFTQIWLSGSEFKAKFDKEFPGGSSAVDLGFAALGYDSVAMLAELRNKITLAGSAVDSPSLLSGLKEISYKGISGTTAFSAERVALKREPVLQVNEGKIVEAQGKLN